MPLLCGLGRLQTLIVTVLQHRSHNSERALVILDEQNMTELVKGFVRRRGGLIRRLHSC